LPAAEGAAGVSGEVLEDLARALHLEFDYLGSMKAYERAYSAYRREGNLLAAARAAEVRRGWRVLPCVLRGHPDRGGSVVRGRS